MLGETDPNIIINSAENNSDTSLHFRWLTKTCTLHSSLFLRPQVLRFRLPGLFLPAAAHGAFHRPNSQSESELAMWSDVVS